MPIWKNDKELFALARKELFTALVGDTLDKMGFLHQFLPPNLKPLDPKMKVIGRAMPLLESDVLEEIRGGANNPLMKKTFGLMFEALDSLKEDDVYICTGASPAYALWGGLMSARALILKAAGAVMNGYSRDTNEILKIGFPTFSLGTFAQDQGPRGKVLDYNVTIEWDGIRVSPGDIVFGDRDGVLIVPKEIEKEVFVKAFEKGRTEKLVLKAIQNGMSTGDAFEKFGVM